MFRIVLVDGVFLPLVAQPDIGYSRAFVQYRISGFVRSGILTCVHAFAVDPERGTFILVLLGIFIGGALLLFALRANTIS